VNAVVLTGAAGAIGSTLRGAWRGRFSLLRLVDVQQLGEEGEGEETCVLDLADLSAARRAVEGADAVVHLAAIPVEDRFDRLLEANVAATYNVFEASRQAGVRRIVFASTNHVTGFYPRSERIGPDDPVRPDSLYGVTKVFGEALGRLYADKWGLEVVCLRIGAFGERPRDAAALPMWLSPDDAVRLFTRALEAPGIPRFLVVYGLSKVEGPWWENPGAAVLGYEPEDEVDPELRRTLVTGVDPSDGPQGGPFAAREYWVEP
jgi:uronate dehydrogenase